MKEEKKGTVTLVGAGCSKDLITVRGLKAIQKADVILYDDLIDSDLLLLAGGQCETVYVGKRYQKHSFQQEGIEELLIQYASEGKNVVRLKGGDSFVFGRGGEEILALQKADIPYEVVPGVTSCVAVPEELGIPVTHRKMARSFTVITGHTTDGTGENYEALARLDGTLVFLMGLHAAGTIAEELMRYGKDPKTPAAVLSRGFTRDEKRMDCTLDTLEKTAKKAASPAILVVGEVASLHFEKTVRRPLAHVPVAVTGSEHLIRVMTDALEEYGADVTACPCLLIHAKPQRIPEDFSEFDWIVFTSANGVRIFFEELQRRKCDLRSLAGQKFAVIGRGTAKSLASYGIQADFIPERFISDVFGRELAERIRKDEAEKREMGPERRMTERAEKVLILRAENGSPHLTEELDRAGIRYQDIKIYETYGSAGEDEDVARKLEKSQYITFSSAAGVRAYFERYRLPKEAVPVCIGPSTASEFERHSSVHCLVPKEYTVQGMLDEILKCESKNQE